MSTTTLEQPRTRSNRGEPVWELAEKLFPRQGEWTPEAFLQLDMNGTELVDGFLEFKPMANEPHNDILFFLLTLLNGVLHPENKGKASFATLKVRTIDKNRREPDIVAILAENYDRYRQTTSWLGADFVLEIVSPDNPNRDYVEKRTEYAAAGIREYWIVDPTQRQIVVLTLDPGKTVYREVGTFRDDQVATSVLIDGFTVKPNDVWASVQND